MHATNIFFMPFPRLIDLNSVRTDTARRPAARDQIIRLCEPKPASLMVAAGPGNRSNKSSQMPSIYAAYLCD
jgi:hypothetical protein